MSAAPLMRVLELRRLEVQRVHEIDTANHCFDMTFFVTLAFPGGATDEYLTSEIAEFPIGEDGKPTFRPSALWYSEQIDFNNGREVQQLGCKVLQEDGDLELRLYYSGKFHESLELQDYPFDDQYLTVSLCINCRRDGKMPVKFAISKHADITIDPSGFAPRATWRMDRSVLIYVDPMDGDASSTPRTRSSSSRQFPSINFSVHARRRQGVVMHAVALPSFMMSTLSLIQYCLPLEESVDRVNVMLTLVLTVFLTKLAAMGLMPETSYFTILDRYLFACESLIMLGAIESGMLAYVTMRTEGSTSPFVNVDALVEESASSSGSTASAPAADADGEISSSYINLLQTANRLDGVLFFTHIGLWVIMHIYFYGVIKITWMRNNAGFPSFTDHSMAQDELDWENLTDLTYSFRKGSLKRDGTNKTLLVGSSLERSSTRQSLGGPEPPRGFRRLFLLRTKEAMYVRRPSGWRRATERLLIGNVDELSTSMSRFPVHAPVMHGSQRIDDSILEGLRERSMREELRERTTESLHERSAASCRSFLHEESQRSGKATFPPSSVRLSAATPSSVRLSAASSHGFRRVPGSRRRVRASAPAAPMSNIDSHPERMMYLPKGSASEEEIPRSQPKRQREAANPDQHETPSVAAQFRWLRKMEDSSEQVRQSRGNGDDLYPTIEREM